MNIAKVYIQCGDTYKVLEQLGYVKYDNLGRDFDMFRDDVRKWLDKGYKAEIIIEDEADS